MLLSICQCYIASNILNPLQSQFVTFFSQPIHINPHFSRYWTDSTVQRIVTSLPSLEHFRLRASSMLSDQSLYESPGETGSEIVWVMICMKCNMIIWFDMYNWVYKYITGHNNVIQPFHTGFTWHGDYLYPLAVMPTCAILYLLLSMFFSKYMRFTFLHL